MSILKFMDNIIIKDAYENNLKHINIELPLHAFTCVTGCSGCGKSSLVFDTIYAESQRGFLEGMTGNLYGQKLMTKPKVGMIKNLRPALNISQNYYNVNPRSTIGTVTDISYYIRALFSIVNSSKDHPISENTFSPNNPKSLCPNCFGLGYENIVSEDLLIPDRMKTLREGGILLYKGPAEGKEQRYLEALCKHYAIDINKKICELSQEELNILLYSNDQIKYKISYKEGKRRKQHYVFLQGAITEISNRLKNLDTISTTVYSQYLKSMPCHICHGSKLRPEILNYKVNGLNIADVESMELTELSDWLKHFDFTNIRPAKRDLVKQLIEAIDIKLKALLQLNIGYLSLNRSIPTISGGERQRVRIATQLSCSLQGLIYILDEPCKGLHFRDNRNIIKATRELVDKGNTVIAIEHNKEYIKSADKIVELGPVGGPLGGYVINENKKVAEHASSLSFKKTKKADKYLKLNGVTYRNIKNQNVEIPLKRITCITGVSGSGKSTLTEVIIECVKRKTNVFCDSIDTFEDIRHIINVNQSPIGKNPRSTIISYLGIYDEIRKLFSETERAKKLKLKSSSFSMNVKGGRCECCQGTGLQKIELNYLPSSYIKCPECSGKRFHDDVLTVDYKGFSILDVLENPISDVMNIFQDSPKIYSVLQSMISLGLGYLTLGQMSMNLSGGEAQRIKLAKALGAPSKGNTLYILDEPTSGLNSTDIDKLIKVLLTIEDDGNTIIAVEHNIEFIARVSDYIIDFGIYGGNAGGTITAQGDTKAVFSDANSSLYGFLQTL